MFDGNNYSQTFDGAGHSTPVDRANRTEQPICRPILSFSEVRPLSEPSEANRSFTYEAEFDITHKCTGAVTLEWNDDSDKESWFAG